MKKIISGLLLTALLLTVLTVIPVMAENDEEVIRVGMWSSPGNVSAINADSSYGYFVVSFVFDPLVELRPDFTFAGRLADSWDISEDGKTFTFHLNPDASWHDGTPLTAEDVMFTIKTVAGPGVQTNRGSSLRSIEGLDATGKMKEKDADISGVNIIDEHTIAITTKSALDPARFLEQFGTNLFIIPKHKLEGLSAEELAKADALLKPTVGNGPFHFVKYVTDQYIELESYDDYYKGPANADRIFIRIVDASSITAQLIKGEIDVVAGPGIGEIPLNDWNLIQNAENVRAVTEPALGYQFMAINNEKPYFQDARARRALAMGINRKLMVDQLYKGEAALARGPLSPITPYDNKEIDPLPYDPDQASSLLQLADWNFDQTIELLVPTGNKQRELSANIIQANLKQIGMDVKIQQLDFPSVLSKVFDDDFDLVLLGWTDTFDPDHLSSTFMTGGQYNLSNYSNEKLDKLIEEAGSARDPEDRKVIYDKIQILFQKEVPAVFLYYPNMLAAVNKRLVNADPSIVPFEYRVDEWDIREE